MKIVFLEELPQWIISSDIAAYHPTSKTIYIKKGLGLKTFPVLIHELCHWFIDKFLWKSLHKKLDKK